MNKILFRAKQAGGSGKWVYGFYVEAETLDKSGIEYFIIEKSADGESHLIIPKTVGQYTGLTDKDGTKIFEGDIIENCDFNAEEGGYGVVEYNDGVFELNGNNISATFHENYWSSRCEVIGNIHDNLELLKGGADND